MVQCPMPKVQRPMSPYAAEAAVLLGGLLRKARIDGKLKAAEVAERAGMSRGLLRRIEAGDPGCAIGAVFEVAAVVGLPLFNFDRPTMSRTLDSSREIMALIPKSVRSSRFEVDDDF